MSPKQTKTGPKQNSKHLQEESQQRAEKNGINLYSEYSLHAQLKNYLAQPGDRFEAAVDGKVVDVLRADGEIVEVQTGHFGQIKSKLLSFAQKGYRVRLVYPIAVQTEIQRLDPVTGELLSRRRSPKRGNFYQIFAELIRAPELIAAPNVTIQIIFVKSVVVKVRDGTGSWWRNGDRIIDRELAEVVASQDFSSKEEWQGLLPSSLSPPFTTSSLSENLGIKPIQARQLLYCFRRAGLLVERGTRGRAKLFEKS